MLLSSLRARLRRSGQMLNPRREPTAPSARILLNTLPKSGSVFLCRTLSASLSLPGMYLGNAYSLIDQISLERMRRFAGGSYVSQNHLAPSEENLQILEHFGCRLVLHLRDPRQALVSLVHHLDRVCDGDHNESLLMFAPRTPPGYFAADFARKLDWQIDNYLPLMTDWITSWASLHDTGRLPILLTNCAEMSRDVGDLCRRICEFSAVPPERLRFVDIPKTIDNHFRLGDDSEWLRVYSPAQIERAAAIVPAELARRFGWATPKTRPDRRFRVA